MCAVMSCHAGKCYPSVLLCRQSVAYRRLLCYGPTACRAWTCSSALWGLFEHWPEEQIIHIDQHILFVFNYHAAMKVESDEEDLRVQQPLFEYRGQRLWRNDRVRKTNKQTNKHRNS